MADYLFEAKYDPSGKKYAYTEKKLVLTHLLHSAVQQLSGLGQILSEEENKEVEDLMEALVMEKEKPFPQDEAKNYSEFNGEGVEIHSNQFTLYYEEKDEQWIEEKLERVKELNRKLAEKIKIPEMSEFYRINAELIDISKGNFYQAVEENPFLGSLVASRTAIVKSSESMPMEKAVNGMKGLDEAQKNLPENQKVDIFADYMTVLNGGEGELAAEYQRQELDRDGWEDQEAVDEYAKKLRREHQKIIDAFERLCEVEDKGQYDAYINNILNHLTEQRPANNGEGAIRGLTAAIGAMKGEVHALDKGWGARDVGIFSVFGAIEGGINKAKHILTDKDQIEMNKVLEEDFKKFKDKYWDLENPTAEEKLQISRELKGFISKYRSYPAFSWASSSFSRMEKCLADIRKDAEKEYAEEHSASEVSKRDDKEYQNVLDYYEQLQDVMDSVKRIKETFNKIEEIMTNDEKRRMQDHKLPETGLYRTMRSALNELTPKKKELTPDNINLNLSRLVAVMDKMKELQPGVLPADMIGLARDGKELLGNPVPEMNAKLKGSVDYNRPFRESMEVMMRSGKNKAAVYVAGGLMDLKNDNPDNILGGAEFEVVGDDEIRAAKAGAIDRKRYEAEHKEELEATAKRNLEERKAREKAEKNGKKGKSSKTDVKHLIIEEGIEEPERESTGRRSKDSDQPAKEIKKSGKKK